MVAKAIFLIGLALFFLSSIASTVADLTVNDLVTVFSLSLGMMILGIALKVIFGKDNSSREL